MSRTGSGKLGGRSYRLNWTDRSPEYAAFSDYAIDGAEYCGSRQPFLVLFRGKPLQRAHGNFTGYRRFASMEAAKRWVERREADRLGWRAKVLTS